MIRYLLDEHMPWRYCTAMRKVHPDISVWAIGDPGAPPFGTTDPDILCWCEEHEFILITNNRKTMPLHIRDHLAQGRHIPGIFIVDTELPTERFVAELALIAGASFAGEYLDRVEFLPLT